MAVKGSETEPPPYASTPVPHILTPAHTPFPYRPTHCALSKVKDRSCALVLSQSKPPRPLL